jgi:hypothetical protein
MDTRDRGFPMQRGDRRVSTTVFSLALIRGAAQKKVQIPGRIRGQERCVVRPLLFGLHLVDG